VIYPCGHLFPVLVHDSDEVTRTIFLQLVLASTRLTVIVTIIHIETTESTSSLPPPLSAVHDRWTVRIITFPYIAVPCSTSTPALERSRLTITITIPVSPPPPHFFVGFLCVDTLTARCSNATTAI
jgi:hypothetical protein